MLPFNHHRAGVFLLGTITVLGTVFAIAAETFTGTVIDCETGEGVKEVTITLSNSAGSWVTDQDGHFSFSTDVPVGTGRLPYRERNLLVWRNAAHAFDLKNASQVTSLTLYNLKGGRLFFKERIAGNNLLLLPGLPNNTYLVRIGMPNGRSLTVKWMHMGNNAVFALGTCCGTTGLLSRQAEVVGNLVFEKTGYQKKEVDVDSDSTYTAMQVNMKPEIGYVVFKDDTIRTYRLSITESNLATLLDYGKLVPDKYTVNSVFVPARLEVEGRVLDSIAVRFRGDQSLTDCVAAGARRKDVNYPQFGFGNSDICSKFSMKFDFNRYDEDGRLYGLKALNFRSMSADPTKMHERLGYSVYADMNIPVPRTGWARLYVNDSLWGLYGLAEEVDGRFTKSRYPETGDGNLYKEVWPATQFSDGEIMEGLATNNDPEDNPDVRAFVALRDTVVSSGTTEDNFLQRIGVFVDVPHLLRYIIVDRAIMNFDGMMSGYGNSGDLRHNYFWYHDQESGLFKLIPWDLDKVFLYPEPNFWTNNQPVGDNLIPNWNVVNSDYTAINCVFDPGPWGSYNTVPIDKDKFLRLFRNTTWNDFKAQGKTFLDSVFTEERLNARLQQWRTLIAKAVGEDKTIDSTEWSLMVDSLSHTIPLLRTNLQMMIDTLIVR